MLLQFRAALAETRVGFRQLLEPSLRLLTALVQLGQPRAARHLAGAATDERRRRLAPGAAQHAVAKLACRRDPNRALILCQGDRGEHAAHRLRLHPTRAWVVTVDRGLEHVVQARAARWILRVGREQHVMGAGREQLAGGAHPRVEDPGRLQGGLDPGPLGLRHAGAEVDQQPQRRSGALLAG